MIILNKNNSQWRPNVYLIAFFVLLVFTFKKHLKFIVTFNNNRCVELFISYEIYLQYKDTLIRLY